MTRGVIYIVWGNKCQRELERSMASVRRWGLPIEVLEGDPAMGHGQKARMYHRSPFDVTLYLDTDTFVADDLAFGFDSAQRHGIAISICDACNATLHWQLSDVPRDLVEYNTGVLFFRKGPAEERLFAEWQNLTPPSAKNDQPTFARAVHNTAYNPFVLPLTWNFRAEFGQAPIYGPIKVWHSRVPLPGNLAEHNQSGEKFAQLRDSRLLRRTRLTHRRSRIIRFFED